jgi:hypothetical protein
MVTAVKRELDRDPASLSGQIIFQKDGYNMSKESPIVDALPRQLDLLQSCGYEVITVSELLEMSPFGDVSPSAPYFSGIRALARAGYRAGFRDNSFKPDRPVTAAELEALLEGPWPEAAKGAARLANVAGRKTGVLTARQAALALSEGDERVAARLLGALPPSTDADGPVSRGWAAQMAAAAMDLR